MTKALAAVVLAHLGVTVVHGWAHNAAHVDLDPWAMAFVVAVIVVGPLAGLTWMTFNRRAGALIVALTMTASLVFGLVNHFIIDAADRVDHVHAQHGWFEGSAVLLVLTEATAAALGFACARRQQAALVSPVPSV